MYLNGDLVVLKWTLLEPVVVQGSGVCGASSWGPPVVQNAGSAENWAVLSVANDLQFQSMRRVERPGVRGSGWLSMWAECDA